MRHVLEAQQFSRGLIEQLCRRSDELEKLFTDKDRDKLNLLKGRMMFTVFYEPSTRTRISFNAAAEHLGMRVVSTENAKEFSSAAKGETLEDTIQTLCQYRPDVIVLRHFETGAAAKAAAVSSVPILNAGDGTGQHPTQALLDIYTIKKELGKVDDLEVVIGGDLTHGRTARSLAYLLSKFKNNSLTFLSPKELKIGSDIKDYLSKHGVKFKETSDMETALKNADVVYWTRIQKERFDSSKLKQTFVIGKREMALMKDKAIVMHPLPRVDEISKEVDLDPRAAYFRQAGNGMFMRMALIEWVLQDNG
ncbi:MAG TPA: aspartate carbamoyltransferase [Candidatus Saccharimonadia bacterium]|nr:aspartate carbamoyltransferase [Candidatus Saccharimonadia bacterium]